MGQNYHSCSDRESPCTCLRGRHIRRGAGRLGLMFALAAGLWHGGCAGGADSNSGLLLALLFAGGPASEASGPGLPAGVAAINYQGEFNPVTERDALAVAPVDSAELAAALASNGGVFYDSLSENIRPLRITFTGDLEAGLAPEVRVADSGGNLASGVVSFQLPRTLIFTPTTAFAHNTQYNVSVNGIRFADGRQRLAQPLGFEFSTAASTPGMPFPWTLEVSCPDQSVAGGGGSCRLRLHPPIAMETAMANPEAGDFPANLDVYLALSGANYITESFFSEDQFVVAPGSNGLYFEFPAASPEGYYDLFRYTADPAVSFDPGLFLFATVDYLPGGATPPVQEIIVVVDGALNINIVYSRTR